MFVKTLRLYVINDPDYAKTPGLRHNLLNAFRALPVELIGEMQSERFGWAVSFELAPGCVWLTATLQEKKIKPATLNRFTNTECARIEQEEDHHLGSKERAEIKERIRAQLLPRIVPEFRTIHGWIDLEAGLLVTDANSDQLADLFVSYLRETLGTLPVIPIGPRLGVDGRRLLTAWYQGDRPESIDIGHKLALVMPQDPTVKSTHNNLDHDAPEIKHGLDSGMLVHKLAVGFDGQLDGVLDDALVLKSVRWSDALVDQALDSETAHADRLLQLDAARRLFDVLRSYQRED